MQAMVRGERVALVPATLSDRRRIYAWCFQSDTTKSHAGPPDYPDIPIPTYEAFYASDDGGYTDYYFTGTRPEDGRGFLIEYEGEATGFISYSAFHLRPGMAELDIWMNAEASCGKGLGVDALAALCRYLHEAMGMQAIIIAPAAKNTRAIRAYEKAGFRKTDTPMRDFLQDAYMPTMGDGDYGVDGTAILIRRFDA